MSDKGFYKGEKKKKKKEVLEEHAGKIKKVYITPSVEIISKGRKAK